MASSVSRNILESMLLSAIVSIIISIILSFYKYSRAGKGNGEKGKTIDVSLC